MKVSFTIDVNNRSISKTNTFNEDDTIQNLFENAKNCLHEFKEDWVFTIEDHFVDGNILLKKYIADCHQSENPIKLRIERKIPIFLMVDKKTINITVYENTLISKSPSFCKVIPDNFNSYQFYFNSNKIDINTTPKYLKLEPNDYIEAVNKNCNINIQGNNKSFFNSVSKFTTFESDSSQNINSQLSNENQGVDVELPISTENTEHKNNSVNQNDDRNLNIISQHQIVNNDSNTKKKGLQKLFLLEMANSSSAQDSVEYLKKDKNKLSVKPNSPSILTPSKFSESQQQDQNIKPITKQKEVYATIIVKDTNGNDEVFNIQNENLSTAAKFLLDLRASDIINAYCFRCGIEPEAMLLFTAKWNAMNQNSLIWPFFLKEKKENEEGNKFRKRTKEKIINETKSPEKVLKKINNLFSERHTPIVVFYLRQIKELLQHFDIIVSGIPYQIKEDQLQTYFERFGPVIKVLLFKNIQGKSKGIARITFKNQSDANKAIENDNKLNYPDGKNSTFFHIFKPNIRYASFSNRENVFQ